MDHQQSPSGRKPVRSLVMRTLLVGGLAFFAAAGTAEARHWTGYSGYFGWGAPHHSVRVPYGRPVPLAPPVVHGAFYRPPVSVYGHPGHWAGYGPNVGRPLPWRGAAFGTGFRHWP
jgi:hypothetical protein